MLYEFLIKERNQIIALCQENILLIINSKSSSEKIEKEVSIFYDELVEILRVDSIRPVRKSVIDNIHTLSANRRGKESLKLGYSISQVVHSYGAICQAITQYLETNKDTPTSAREFNRLNLCLDSAIAEAVSEFSRVQRENATQDEAQRLGFLAHELRNALSHATIAYRMIKSGRVGSGGETAQLLEDSHTKMRDIIDRSLAEVRLQGDPHVHYKKYGLIDLISEVEITTSYEASAKLIHVYIDSDPMLEIFVDRHLIMSALSNLVQNAIKFTKPSGNVWIRGKKIDERILIEIEDSCGGLPLGMAEELFLPFNQQGADRSGLGLGLTISRRAVTLNNGKLQVRNIPGQGCVFSIDLPAVEQF